MAKYTPSGLLGELSGKLGDQVYSHNRGGPYVRSLGVVDQPGSARQTVVWANWAAVAAAWSSVISLNREDLWDTWAQQWTKRKALGRKYTYTGRDAFTAINVTRLGFGLAQITFPPLYLGWTYLESLEMEGDTSSGGLMQALFSNSPLPTGNRVIIGATPPLLTTQDSFNRPYTAIHYSADPFATDTELHPDYVAAGFAFPVDGQLVSLRIRMVNASYMPGPAQYVQVRFSH